MSPPGTATRPTSDRVREAIFNALYSLGGVEGALVADLYAGTGALGIEALSRGADRAVFVERSRPALDALRANLAATGLAARAEVVAGDVDAWLARMPRVDIALVDPPYADSPWAEVFGRLRADLVVAESGGEIEVPAGWRIHRVKRYGTSVVTIALASDASPTEPAQELS